MEDERKGGAFLAPRTPTQPRYSLTSNNLDLFFLNHPYIVLVIRRWERRCTWCRKKEYPSQLYSVTGLASQRESGRAKRTERAKSLKRRDIPHFSAFCAQECLWFLPPPAP